MITKGSILQATDEKTNTKVEMQSLIRSLLVPVDFPLINFQPGLDISSET